MKLEAVAEALQDDYEVAFELLTTGSLAPSAIHDLASFQETLSEVDHPDTSLTLVDGEVLEARWDEALSRDLPGLSHTFILEPGRYLSMEVANFKTVLAAIPLRDCLQLPGMRDGTLFRRNVRQSLGLTNKINRGLKQTIVGDTQQYFFLYHNGITALCENMQLDPRTHQLCLRGLSIVNGCQSLNTIIACSEKIRGREDSYVLFRFYEIPQQDLADKISIYTNSQSAVKPRDLRSNDKRVIALKRAYENAYRDGYLIVKRGEERPADRDTTKTVDVVTLARCLMAWHCQRPNIAYNENKLFDKYFEQLFRSDYSPADILALSQWAQYIESRWRDDSLDLNEALLAAPSYSKFHLLFAIQSCFAFASGQADKVPSPAATVHVLHDAEMIVTHAANCYNSALEAAINEYSERGRIFSTQNWLKNKDSVTKIQSAVRMWLPMALRMPGGQQVRQTLLVAPDRFSLRWSAD